MANSNMHICAATLCIHRNSVCSRIYTEQRAARTAFDISKYTQTVTRSSVLSCQIHFSVRNNREFYTISIPKTAYPVTRTPMDFVLRIYVICQKITILRHKVEIYTNVQQFYVYTRILCAVKYIMQGGEPQTSFYRRETS